MKKSIILQSFICLLAVSCTVRELDVVTPTPAEGEEDVFYASLESYEPDSKVYLDESVKILWDEDDRISIFNKSTLNQQYRFDGETGENAGTFHRVPNSYFGAGNDLDYICSIYPYQESATISNSEVLTLTLPEEQTYREKSFGPGANTMVSITDDKLLKFKNVGGYLALKFYGEDVSVSSIRLIGNNGEPLSGEATMQLPFTTEPALVMSPSAGKTIVLNCEEPVQLGTSREDATIFWMVVPPTDFTDGFTLLVSNPDGDVYIKETHVHLTIDRNGVLRIAPIEVEMNSEGLSIDDAFSADREKLPSRTSIEGRTVTVTMPTLNRTHLLLDYEFSGEYLMANGERIVPGVTPLDISKPVTLTVRDGIHGKNYDLVGCNTGLPVVRITTDGYFSLADLEDYDNALDSDDGLDHRIWLPEAKDDFVTIRVENADGTPGMKNNSGVPVYELDTKIKGRGNYTWRWDKKPYALKFDKKGEVLGMPAHKRWILLANWRDHTLLRNDATFWLSKQSGLPYTVRGQFVELEFNGEYRGNYYLCEQIKIDKNRVNIKSLDDDFSDLSGGYLMEIDSYWDEINKFHSAEFTLNYMFKEPDEDPSDPETNPSYALGYDWMEKHIAEFERVLKTESSVLNGDFNNYLDVDSAIMFMIINELSGNRDFFQGAPHSGPHSTYLYKDKGGKIFMGPGWDFDYETFIPYKWYDGRGYARSYKWRGFDNTGYYYHYLCYNQDFVDRIKTLWNSKKETFLGLTDYIDQMVAKISLSQEFDSELWPYHNEENRNDNHDYKGYSYAEAIALMKSSFTSKVTWMNTEINNLTTTSPTFKYNSPRNWPKNQ